MKHLEKEVMDTTAPDMRPKIWHQYIDYSCEVSRREKRDELTAHLNTIDKTGSIKSQINQKRMEASLFWTL